MFRLFKRKRKQCVKCRKTFYKSFKDEGDYPDFNIYEVSPCCKSGYIIV
jgi:hypothetical protein